MKHIVTLLLLALFGLSVSARGADTSGAKAAAKKPRAAKAAAKKAAAKADTAKPKETKLPKLVDLGADRCVPCKMMAPILEELKKDYAGKLDVVFIDVWKDAGEGEKYKIRVIPTQILYGPEGKELFRHEGFFAKEDILAKWKELGYELKP